MLRIQELRLPGGVAEEGRVEGLHVAEGGRRPHVGRVPQRLRAAPRLQQLLVREERHGLNAVAQVLPESLDAIRAGEAASHANDGDFELVHAWRRHELPPLGRPALISHIAARCSSAWKITSPGLRCCPTAFSSRATTRMDNSECPPRSKKLS